MILALIGVGLVLYSTTLPAYTNETEKRRWDRAASDHFDKPDRNKFQDQYYSAISQLTTKKNYIMDAGIGTISLAGTLLFLSFLWKIRQLKDIFKIQSPKRSVIFKIADSALLATIPSNIVYYVRTQTRGDYPSFADSIAIPIFIGAIAVIAFLPLLNLVIAGFTHRSTHAARLFTMFPSYTFASILTELFFGLVFLITVLILLGMILSGDMTGIPICMALLYVFMSLRAGKIQMNRA